MLDEEQQILGEVAGDARTGHGALELERIGVREGAEVGDEELWHIRQVNGSTAPLSNGRCRSFASLRTT
jgi:hypothetical protein